MWKLRSLSSAYWLHLCECELCPKVVAPGSVQLCSIALDIFCEIKLLTEYGRQYLNALYEWYVVEFIWWKSPWFLEFWVFVFCFIILGFVLDFLIYLFVGVGGECWYWITWKILFWNLCFEVVLEHSAREVDQYC